jgi:hypothetical protein
MVGLVRETDGRAFDVPRAGSNQAAMFEIHLARFKLNLNTTIWMDA